MEPGSDAASRKELPGDPPQDLDSAFHGKTPKRRIEGLPIYIQAGQYQSNSPLPVNADGGRLVSSERIKT
jgi:hypothetical protein